MAIVLGLLVALTYGTGDFFGGLAAKRTPTTTVVIGSFALSAAVLVATTAIWTIVGDPPTPQDRDLVLGLGVGLLGPGALGLLYHGLATGRMSVVAPITAVVAASVPLTWGLLQGERPGPVALGGVVVALVAVGLISAAPTHADHPEGAAERPTREVVPSAVLCGVGFGVIFILLAETSDDAGLWPLVVARPFAVAVTVAATLVLVRARGTQPHRWRAAVVPAAVALPAVAGAGILDVTANVFYLAATNAGLLSIVAVLSSLYPAATVVLARVFLGERLHRIQVVGLVLATGGVVAMAGG